MRSNFLGFSFQIGLLSLAAWGIAACGGGEDLTLSAGSTASTGSGGSGTGGNGTGGSTSGSGGSGTGGSTSGTGGAGTGGGSTTGTGGAGTGGGSTSGSGGSGGGSACADTWVITYDLVGQFTITDTPFGVGNTMQPIGPGTLSIRFLDNNGTPVPGSAQLLSYNMKSMFVLNVMGLVVTTDVTANSGPNECGVARGTLIDMNLVWDTCTYNPMTWTPQSAGMGPGCVQAYHTTGNINCNDMSTLGSCMQGGLMDGNNPQDTTWDQPFNGFELTADLVTFRMRNLNGPQPPMGVNGVELPNDSPGRTWINLDGTEKMRALQTTPACACP